MYLSDWQALALWVPLALLFGCCHHSLHMPRETGSTSRQQLASTDAKDSLLGTFAAPDIITAKKPRGARQEAAGCFVVCAMKFFPHSSIADEPTAFG
jgi:hypothetical protein